MFKCTLEFNWELRSDVITYRNTWQMQSVESCSQPYPPPHKKNDLTSPQPCQPNTYFVNVNRPDLTTRDRISQLEILENLFNSDLWPSLWDRGLQKELNLFIFHWERTGVILAFLRSHVHSEMCEKQGSICNKVNNYFLRSAWTIGHIFKERPGVQPFIWNSCAIKTNTSEWFWARPHFSL